tara:strand:+ start:57 stop:425 length:369 start_codon:yes stop_codon:yes gene_type:complete
MNANKCTAEQLKQMLLDDGHTNVTVVGAKPRYDAGPVDLLMDAAGFVGNELFQTHEVVALMQKAFDKGWDQTGVAATSLHQDFPNTHNHNRDKHVVRFLKKAMAEQEFNDTVDRFMNTGEEL